MDVLYTDESIKQHLSCRVLPFSQLVRETKSIRGVCSSWANATRSLVFRRKPTRDGLVLELPRLLSEEDLWTFPLLRDCMVELYHPHSFRQLDSLQQDLAKSSEDSLKYVCAVTWKGRMSYLDSDNDRDWVGYMVYGHKPQKMVDTFKDKYCRQNCGNSVDSEQFEEALGNYIFKELLALWYYNAHIIRQILSAFPLLEYLDLPNVLRLALLTMEEYFFPECTNLPSIRVNLFSPAQILETMGITYTENGRRYSDIMGSVKAVNIF